MAATPKQPSVRPSSTTPGSLPGVSTSTSNSSFFSQAGSSSPSVIHRLQAEYPTLKLQVPAWAEQEWTKDEARLFFETQGLIKPARKPQAGFATKQAARRRLLEERLQRRLRDVSALQTELGMVAARPFAPTELNELAKTVGGVQELLRFNVRLPGRVTSALDKSASQLSGVETTLRSALTAGASTALNDPPMRESRQEAALRRRLTQEEAQSSIRDEANQRLTEELMEAQTTLRAAHDQRAKARVEIGKLQRQLREAGKKQQALVAKARKATQLGYNKADDALRMRATAIFELEMRVEEGREAGVAAERKVRLLQTQLDKARQDNDGVRQWAEAGYEQLKATRRELNSTSIRARTQRDECAWLRQQLERSLQ
jgi:hypothetical protein